MEIIGQYNIIQELQKLNDNLTFWLTENHDGQNFEVLSIAKNPKYDRLIGRLILNEIRPLLERDLTGFQNVVETGFDTENQVYFVVYEDCGGQPLNEVYDCADILSLKEIAKDLDGQKRETQQTYLIKALAKRLANRTKKWIEMKKCLALLFFALFTTVLFGQSNYQDVVYLKNGSIIRGMIIEQVPNKSIKIETADKSVFVFQMDEIEKITKEAPPDTKQLKNKSVRRKGYIGFSIGPSFPISDFAQGYAETGIQLNLVNFGYRFTDNFGIAATWLGAVNPIEIDGIDPWAYGGLMAGPLLSIPLSEKAELDFRPTIGYALTIVPDLGFGSEQPSSFAFSIGTVFRINVGEKVALLLNADYFSTKAESKKFNVKQQITTISFGLGVAYRLK